MTFWHIMALLFFMGAGLFAMAVIFQHLPTLMRIADNKITYITKGENDEN